MHGTGCLVDLKEPKFIRRLIEEQSNPQHMYDTALLIAQVHTILNYESHCPFTSRYNKTDTTHLTLPTTNVTTTLRIACHSNVTRLTMMVFSISIFIDFL